METKHEEETIDRFLPTLIHLHIYELKTARKKITYNFDCDDKMLYF